MSRVSSPELLWNPPHGMSRVSSPKLLRREPQRSIGLHEKGLQRQKGAVPLVGSQEQSALLVPLINR